MTGDTKIHVKRNFCEHSERKATSAIDREMRDNRNVDKNDTWFHIGKNMQEETGEFVGEENRIEKITLGNSIVQDPDQILPIEVAIRASIFSHSSDKYIKSPGTDKDSRCDNYVEAILNESGADSSNYLSGPAKDKTVQNHIDNGLNNGTIKKQLKKSAPQLEKGYYVVFMNDSNIISPRTGKVLEPHTGILCVNDDKSVEFSDNSSIMIIKEVQAHRFGLQFKNFKMGMGIKVFITIK